MRNNNSNFNILVFYFLITAKATMILPFSALNAENLDKLNLYDEPVILPKTSFFDIKGKKYTFDDFLGKLLIVNLWATWCAPCIDEMPTLINMQKILKNDVVVLAISQDRNKKIIEPFIRENKWSELGFYISQDLNFAKNINIRGLPTTIIISSEGEEIGRLEGTIEWDDKEVLKIISHLASG